MIQVKMGARQPPKEFAVSCSTRFRGWTRNGYDWTSRYPLIVEAARRIRTKRFVIDGEAVLLGVDGISDFDGLYSGAIISR